MEDPNAPILHQREVRQTPLLTEETARSTAIRSLSSPPIRIAAVAGMKAEDSRPLRPNHGQKGLPQHTIQKATGDLAVQKKAPDKTMEDAAEMHRSCARKEEVPNHAAIHKVTSVPPKETRAQVKDQVEADGAHANNKVQIF